VSFENAGPMKAGSYVAGEWVTATGELPAFDPADLDRRIGAVSLSGPEVAEAAMAAAEEAFPGWRAVELDERCALIERLLDRIESGAEPFAQTIVLENGKTIWEARGEVAGTLKDGRYQLEQVREAGRSAGTRGAEIRHVPLGVFALVTPWNFPLATVVRKLVPAIGLGNTVVLKASEVTPFSAAALFACIEEVGLPPGVANLVVGEGPVVGPALVKHDALRGISFTGSTATGRLLADQVGPRPVRLQLEMGGKNALVVLADADLDAAAEAAAFAGFSVTGQWCTSTSR
jgi:acyl-CoA reductase-like NAD-dependent aldehyde dehydrogenase